MEENMDKALKESIQNFEYKRGFREVKLKTRQSFREDQVALNRRLSRRTDKRKPENGMSDGDTNGKVKTNENGVLSKLESIVLDIGVEKGQENGNESSTDEITISGSEESRSQKNSLDDNIVLDKKREDIQKDTCTSDKTQNRFTHNKSETQKVSHQNGYLVHQENQISNGSNISYGLVPNGHTVLQNGHTSGQATLLVRPKVNVQARAAMTPEPRLKSLKGIYQKNPKLSTSSTDHLDNVSLNGFKLPVTHGQKAEYQAVTVPIVPGAEVASIPADGNLGDLNVEQMVTVFRHFKLPEELVHRLCKCKVDGKRFSVFTDTELRDLGMNNPIIRYFRDRTAQKPKKKLHKFML